MPMRVKGREGERREVDDHGLHRRRQKTAAAAIAAAAAAAFLFFPQLNREESRRAIICRECISSRKNDDGYTRVSSLLFFRGGPNRKRIERCHRRPPFGKS